MRVEDIAKEESVADFLLIHPDRVEWTENVKRAGNLLELPIVEEEPF
jgi:hypothetical protein